MKDSKTYTTSTGMPVDDIQNSKTAGEYGPIVMSDFALIDKIAHFDRQRIPERVVHAKGSGAHGYFEVTNDISKYTKACVFSKVGKKTPVFMRMSTVAGEKGSADTVRDVRGFSIKFYTEEGNWDMVGNNTPVFFIRDPMKFPDFIHSQKRNPQTNLREPQIMWDFWSLSPESTHQVTILFSDRGTPDGFRHINGYSSHTFRWVNSKQQVFWIKMHFKTANGIKNLSNSKAIQICGTNPDYAQQDLFNHLNSGKTTQWNLKIQVMPQADGAKYKWNIFDVTKIWPHSDYPLIPVGKLVLNKNALNYFQDVEQSAFSPGHLIPGMQPSMDKMLQGRLFSYPDTHRHRLGPNYDQIPVNCPLKATVRNGIRDGFMSVNGNQGNLPNYVPNSQNVFDFTQNAKYSPYKVTGIVGRYKPAHPNDDFAQAGGLFRKVFTDQHRNNIIENMSGHLRQANRDVQERSIKNFMKCDPEYGDRLAKELGFPALKSKI